MCRFSCGTSISIAAAFPLLVAEPAVSLLPYISAVSYAHTEA